MYPGKREQAKQWLHDILDRPVAGLASQIELLDQPDGGLKLKFQAHDNSEREYTFYYKVVEAIAGGDVIVRKKVYDELLDLAQQVTKTGSPRRKKRGVKRASAS